MKKWLFCCLLSPLSVFACDFSARKFQKITESEFSTELQLAKKRDFYADTRKLDAWSASFSGVTYLAWHMGMLKK